MKPQIPMLVAVSLGLAWITLFTGKATERPGNPGAVDLGPPLVDTQFQGAEDTESQAAGGPIFAGVDADRGRVLPRLVPRMLVGEVRVIEQAEIAGDLSGSLRVILAKYFDGVDTGSAGVSPRVKRVSDRTAWHGLGGFRPVVSHGDPLAIERGRWICEIPTQDLFVENVTLNGQNYEVLSGVRIPSGASEHALVVRPMGMGELTVVEAFSGAPMDDLEVREVWTPDMTGATETSIGDFRMGFGANHDPSQKEAFIPPDGSVVILQGANSPLAIPLSEKSRQIWIGRAGYGWQVVDWAPSRKVAFVSLEPESRLEIDLVGVEGDRGLFDIYVLEGTEIVESWMSVQHNRLLVVSHLPHGKYRVRVNFAPPNGCVTLINEAIDLQPSESRRVQYDLGKERSILGELGALEAVIVEPKMLSLATLEGSLFLSPVVNGEAGLPTYQRLLSSLDADHGTRSARIDGLPQGQYLVGVLGSGSSELVTVKSGSETHVTLDLSKLGRVTIWPAGGRGELLKALPYGYQLAWAYTARASGHDSGEKLMWTWPLGFWASVRGESSLTFLVPAQKVVVWIMDEAGKPVSELLQIDVEPGESEYAVSLDENRATAVSLRLFGAASRSWSESTTPIVERFKAADGRGRCIFVRTTAKMDGSAKDGMHLLAYFDTEGDYSLNLQGGYDVLMHASAELKEYRVGHSTE